MMKTINLSLNNPAFQDERFRFSYIFAQDDLKTSLLLSGLIYPPWGIEEKKGKFILVSGWKRVVVARELGWKEIPFLVIQETKPEIIWVKLIAENKAHRQLQMVDKAFIIKKMLKMGISRERIKKGICSLLEIPPLVEWISFYEHLAELERETIKVIAAKNLPEYIVRLLFDYAQEERQALIPWLEHLSQNKIKEVLENLQEIALRDQLRPAQIISAFRALEGDRKGEKDLARQAEKWREHLKEKRFPCIQATFLKFQSLLKEINWPPEIEIKPSPFFERNDLRVSFEFTNENELKHMASKLLTLSQNKKIKQLFFGKSPKK